MSFTRFSSTLQQIFFEAEAMQQQKQKKILNPLAAYLFIAAGLIGISARFTEADSPPGDPILRLITSKVLLIVGVFILLRRVIKN